MTRPPPRFERVLAARHVGCRHEREPADASIADVQPLLLGAVKALASAPEEQAAALGHASVDDLALDLDAQPWHDEPPGVRAALDALHALLDAMSGSDNAELWTLEALDGPEWQRVREAARRVLALHRHESHDRPHR